MIDFLDKAALMSESNRISPIGRGSPEMQGDGAAVDCEGKRLLTLEQFEKIQAKWNSKRRNNFFFPDSTESHINEYAYRSHISRVWEYFLLLFRAKRYTDDPALRFYFRDKL